MILPDVQKAADTPGLYLIGNPQIGEVLCWSINGVIYTCSRDQVLALDRFHPDAKVTKLVKHE